MMVAVIENVFIPVFIQNNQGSAHDLAILKEFKERAWNFPVSRFVSGARKDVIPRKAKVYRAKDMVADLSGHMLSALDVGKYEVPARVTAVLEGMQSGKTYTDAEVKQFVDGITGGVGRKLAKALDRAVKAYEGKKYGAAFKAAVKVRDDQGSDKQEIADAEYVIEKVRSGFEVTRATAARLQKEREYLELFELKDKAVKEYAGFDRLEEWRRAVAALQKDKQVKIEVKALKALARLAAKLRDAENEKTRRSAKEKLAKFAEKNSGTRAAEKAASLASG